MDKFEFPYRPLLYYYGYSSVSTLFSNFLNLFFGDSNRKGEGMYEIVEKLMESKGLKPADVAKETGIPSSVFTDWKKGRYTPKADKLYILARFFEVPMEIFFEDPTDKRIAHYFQEINEAKEQYHELSQAEWGDNPVYEIAAGSGRLNDGYPSEVKQHDNTSNEFAWCKVYGNSMHPILLDGDYVKVKYTTDTTPTDLTAIRIDGEACTIKYVEVVADGIWIRAENKDVFEDKFYTTREVLSLPISIIGVVTELQRLF